MSHHHGFILIYDANQPKSFAQLQKWIDFARSVNAKEPVFMLMGVLSKNSENFPQPVRNNKRNASQLMIQQQEVPHAKGKEFSLKNATIFYETSLEMDREMFEMPFEMFLTGKGIITRLLEIIKKNKDRMQLKLEKQVQCQDDDFFCKGCRIF